MTHVFVVNTGSSSIKYRLLELPTGEVRASGMIERIGVPGSGVADHGEALRRIREELGDVPVDVIGHRVVHGGAIFDGPALIDDEVEAAIERLAVLAPLHNPPALLGIRGARAAFPDVPHVAVFDTAFHATLPVEAREYAIDRELAARAGVRRYGFHGTSYQIVSRQAATFLDRPLGELRMVVLHLGNGASAAAISGGRSIDTSMGMTPLQGLVMGTRSGDIDPAVLVHLARTEGFTIAELDTLLNRESGLLGLSGHADMRDVHAAADAGDEAARATLDIVVHRLRHYIGAYAAQLGGLDALVFTAGVGENDAELRRRAVERLGFLGLYVDDALNESGARGARRISPDDAPVAVLVVPTDEEREIAEQSAAFVA